MRSESGGTFRPDPWRGHRLSPSHQWNSGANLRADGPRAGAILPAFPPGRKGSGGRPPKAFKPGWLLFPGFFFGTCRQRCCRRMTAKICCNRSQVRKLSLTHTHIACTVFSPIRTITAHNLYQLFLIVWIFDIYHLKGYLDPAQTRVLAGLLSRPLVCR